MKTNSIQTLCRMAALGVLVLAGAARAAEVSWSAGADGDWDTGANWTGGQVPSVGDSAWMTNRNASYTVTYTNAASQIDLFRVGSESPTTGNITLVIDGSGFETGSKTGVITAYQSEVYHGGLLHVKPGASVTLSTPSVHAGQNWFLTRYDGRILLEGAMETFGGPRLTYQGTGSTTVMTGGSLKFSDNKESSLNNVYIGTGGATSQHTLLIDGGSVEVNTNVVMYIGHMQGTGIIQLNSGSYLHNSARSLIMGFVSQYNRGSAQVLVYGGTFTNILGTTQLGTSGQALVSLDTLDGSTTCVFRVTGGTVGLSDVEMGGTIMNYTRNHLEVSGGTMRAAKITMGSTGITTNSARVAGTGDLTVSGTLWLRSAATFQMDGGTNTVGTLQVEPDDDNALRFNAGTLNVTNATVDTGVETVIGDGAGAMTYKVMGGAHTFAQDLTVNAAATLGVRGAGSIETPLLTFNQGANFELDRTGIASEDPFVALAVDGNVTLPDSVTVSVSGLSGPAPAEIPLITITGTFTGSPATWPRVSVYGDDYDAEVAGDTLRLQRVPRGTMILLR